MKNTNLIIVIVLAALLALITTLIVRSDFSGAIDIEIGVEGIKYRLDSSNEKLTP